MGQETIISETIHTTDKNAQLDAACKQLLSIKIILAWIMKSCLEEYRNFDVNEIAEKYIEGEPVVGKVAVAPDETNAVQKVHGMGSEDTSLTEGTVTYDIRFLAAVPVSGELIRLIVNVEAQGDFYPGYPLTKRGIYYCCRMISAQHGTEFADSHYQDIKKVYSIWIAIKPPQKRQNTITRYHIVEENMVGQVTEPIRNYDLMTLLMICLGQPEDTDCDILKLLDVLLSSEIEATEKQQVLQNDFGIPMTRELEGGLQDMCNLGEVIERESIAKGIAKGIIMSIKNLMDNTGWPVEQAMATLGVPKEDWSKYIELLAMQ